jgi:hypothetical protein
MSTDVTPWSSNLIPPTFVVNPLNGKIGFESVLQALDNYSQRGTSKIIDPSTYSLVCAIRLHKN